MSTEAAYSIADLARLTGVNVRTIRYYLAQGLIPASGESGPGAHYGDGHLHRLQLTRRLQEQHLPLAEIRRRLAELTDAEVETLVATPPQQERETTGSALDYIRTVLGSPASTEARGSRRSSLVGASPPIAPPAMASGGPALLRRAIHESSSIYPAAEPWEPWEPSEPSMPRMRDEPAPPLPSMTTEPAGPERSQWERLSLGPNVEIHIRRPLSRLEQKRVERLITIARQVLKEDGK